MKFKFPAAGAAALALLLLAAPAQAANFMVYTDDQCTNPDPVSMHRGREYASAAPSPAGGSRHASPRASPAPPVTSPLPCTRRWIETFPEISTPSSACITL